MRRRAGLGGVLLLIAVLVAGCEEGDEAFVRDFMADWAFNNLGSTIGGTFGIGDGNEVTAAVGALATIDKVNQADALMNEGRTSGDMSKMDKAIESRPTDWTYRTSRAVLALDRGSLGRYDADVKAAQELSPNRTIRGRTVSGSDREVRQRYNELSFVEVRLRQQLDARQVTDGERCSKIYGEMAAMAAQIQNAARTANDILAFDHYGERRRFYGDRQAQCPTP